MGDLILGEPLASQIRAEAEAQGVDIEAFLKSALKRYRFQAGQEKILAEIRWWQSQSDETRAKYREEWIAIYNQEVIDHDQNEEAIRKRIRDKYGKQPILITPANRTTALNIVSTRYSSL